MKLAVVGSREVDDAEFIEQKLDGYSAQRRIKAVVSGGSNGVDSIAEAWAKRHGIQMIILKPDYENYAPEIAPLMRNNQIVETCDLLLAFWGGKSKGTDYTVKEARKVNKLLAVYFKSPMFGRMDR